MEGLMFRLHDFRVVLHHAGLLQENHHIVVLVVDGQQDVEAGAEVHPTRRHSAEALQHVKDGTQVVPLAHIPDEAREVGRDVLVNELSSLHDLLREVDLQQGIPWAYSSYCSGWRMQGICWESDTHPCRRLPRRP